MGKGWGRLVTMTYSTLGEGRRAGPDRSEYQRVDTMVLSGAAVSVYVSATIEGAINGWSWKLIEMNYLPLWNINNTTR